jgi:DUF4097 and DUF4098 domain-containing protein YvlB
MATAQRLGQLALVMIVCVAALSATDIKKEFKYTVGPKASLSIYNQYGPISVKPADGNQVIVSAVLHSDKVEVDTAQNGNRVDLKTHLLQGATPENSQVDYEVLVPPDTSVTIHSTTGLLHVEQLVADISMEGDAALVDVRDVNNAHVRVKTLNGPVTLTNIRYGHVEVSSVGGDITMHSVSGPLVEISSTSGRILYDGDFGIGGEYKLTSHTGDIDATIPADASVDVTARSVKGDVQNDFPFHPKTHNSFVPVPGRSLVGTAGKAASSVLLRTFSGKIRLKKR